MTPEEARLHLRYSTWASRKLLDAARALPSEDLTRAVGVSHGSILGTLAHVHFADRIWYNRTVDSSEPYRMEADQATLEEHWPAILKKWEAWAESLDEAGLQRIVEYATTGNQTYRTPVWQILLHVVNHATLHRGQAVAMIRQLGIKPPGTDLMFYYRELGAAAAS